MAIHRPPGEKGELGQESWISGHQAGKIHHLSQPQNPGVAPVVLQITGFQTGAGGLKGRSRHAGGQHEEKIYRQAGTGVQEIIQARSAPDVGDLMGVGHHGGRSQG